DINLIQSAETRFKELKQMGATKKGASSRQYKAFGIDTRPKASKDDKKTEKARALLYNWIQRTLDRKGIIVKEDLIKYAKKYYIGEKFASTFIVEICKQFNLERCIINNELITRHNLAKSKHKKAGFIPKNILR
ncbi:hypothetical protein, partial [Clostridium tarantellae]|uniref:hypothetical protein n=1 Tax=Clostridium tarantellae TaxID=39493 RepID=UPI001479021B